MPDDNGPESKEEEIARRDACANAFLGEPQFSTVPVRIYDCL